MFPKIHLIRLMVMMLDGGDDVYADDNGSCEAHGEYEEESETDGLMA